MLGNRPFTRWGSRRQAGTETQTDRHPEHKPIPAYRRAHHDSEFKLQWKHCRNDQGWIDCPTCDLPGADRLQTGHRQKSDQSSESEDSAPQQCVIDDIVRMSWFQYPSGAFAMI